jgi:putative glycosyltransferase
MAAAAYRAAPEGPEGNGYAWAMELSVVSTVYCSAGHLEEFHRRMTAAAELVTSDFELILVNDGSPDGSQDIALGLCRRDPRVRLIELSRNFGHHKAIMTGLAEATGDRVFLIDCDLEEPPELIAEFAAEMRSSGADVVYGVQQTRKGKRFERMSGNLFYWVINLLSSHPVPKNLVTVRLMKRPYVSALVEHRDVEIFLAGLFVITGFVQSAVTIQKGSRPGSSYSFARRVGQLVNAVTSSSVRPLLLIFGVGWVIIVIAGLAGSYLVIRTLFFGHLLPGFTSLMVSLWFLGGLTTFALGIIGIYLSKIYAEVKRRPYTVVRARYGQRAGDEPVAPSLPPEGLLSEMR